VDAAALDLIWGASDIAAVIGRNRRQTFYYLENGAIPGARKVAGRWVVARDQLRRFFAETESA
jgi:hypothetical protein